MTTLRPIHSDYIAFLGNPMVYAHRLLASALIALAVSACGGKDNGEDSSSADLNGPLVYEYAIEPSQLDFEGLPVLYHVPDNVRGVAFGFHGSGTGATYANRIETIAFLNELLKKDIGFIITESVDRDAKQWDTDSSKPSNNEDLTRLLALRQQLIATTAMTESLPIFAFGFSNGGNFTGVFSNMCEDEGLPIKAVAAFSSNCSSCGNGEVPTFWSIPEQDPAQFVNDIKDDLEGRGVATQYEIIPEFPLLPDFFTRNPEVTADQSQRTFDELVSLMMIDANGVRLIPDADADDRADQYGRIGQIKGADFRSEELKVAWTLHRMNGYYAKEIRDFFASRL